jgi:hypothetical protein
MLQFNSVILLNRKGVLLTAVEFDSLPDADGYVSFGINADDRDSVIYINIDYFQPPTFYTPEDAADYFEKINYPQLPPSYSNDDVFTSNELFAIGQAIAIYVFQEQSKSRLK